MSFKNGLLQKITILKQNDMLVKTEIKVMATLTNEFGETMTVAMRVKRAKRGLFKEEIENQIMNTINLNGIGVRIINVKIK